MTTTHTPGEWRVSQTGDSVYIRASKEAIACVWAPEEANEGTVMANATLMASAPRLLEACRAAIIHLSELGVTPEHPTIGKTYIHIVQTINNATN